MKLIKAPKARKRLVEKLIHNKKLSDQFDWIRDDNWQEVLRSPNVLKKNIRKYENRCYLSSI